MLPIANAQCMFSRLTVRANNSLAEDVQNYHAPGVGEAAILALVAEGLAGKTCPEGVARGHARVPEVGDVAEDLFLIQSESLASNSILDFSDSN